MPCSCKYNTHMFPEEFNVRAESLGVCLLNEPYDVIHRPGTSIIPRTLLVLFQMVWACRWAGCCQVDEKRIEKQIKWMYFIRITQASVWYFMIFNLRFQGRGQTQWLHVWMITWLFCYEQATLNAKFFANVSRGGLSLLFFPWCKFYTFMLLHWALNL